MESEDTTEKKFAPLTSGKEIIQEIYYSNTLSLKNKNYLKKLILKESMKNGNKTLNYTEQLVFLAAINLIDENLMHECGYSPIMDKTGIDIFLAMNITVKSRKAIRILVHAQIKNNNELSIKKHKNKYPNIPILIIGTRDNVKEIEKKILIFFKKASKKSGYAKLIRRKIKESLKNYKK